MGLEFIITDKEYKELGYQKNASIDMEIGKYGTAKNDFEVSLPIAEWNSEFDEDSLFYANNTEWGGLVLNKKVDTGGEKITFKGATFRGMLENEFVQPADGEAYLVLKGEANTCINTLISGRLGGLFVVDDIGLSGINVNYQVRDLNLLEALEKTLKSGNAKLDVYFSNLDKKVHLKASNIQDLSDTTRYDNDYQIQMVVETQPQQYNHILALGIGQLTERLRLNLYLQKDGTWGDTEYYAGLDKKTYKYDDVNSETLEALRENALKNIEGKQTTDNLQISFDADNVELFDIVGAKEKITGIEFKAQITQKILKGSIGDVSVSYKIGEDTISKQSSGSESSGGSGGTGGGDAKTLGGKTESQLSVLNSENLGGRPSGYYTRPYNLLDNSDFRNPVNQRGATSYTNWVYSIDRWITSANISLVSGGIKIDAGGYFLQILKQSSVRSGKITGAIKLSDGTILCGSTNYPLSTNDAFILESSNKAVVYVQNSTDRDSCFQFTINAVQDVVVEWVALYEGSYTAETLPPYIPKGYATELNECMRYYQLLRLAIYRTAGSSTGGQLFFQLPIAMYSSPNATLISGGLILADNSNPAISNISGVSVPKPFISGYLTVASASATSGSNWCYGYPWVNGSIALSADL